ncbi:hypothetical protein [Flavobacterium beibuense]|uniref:hypothetical protein n=1 Tax=Flavobacterium beibuense TaxID=657326 RepID=UPI003A92253A
MEKKRLLIVGLEPRDTEKISKELGWEYLTVHYDMLPVVKLMDGVLYVESPQVPNKFLKVDKVIFHGIYEKDVDFLTLLALWDGPCLPNALGMMDLRQRIPGLVRSLQASKFNTLNRSMVINQQEWNSDKEVVAKWGIWHCGEDKHKFNGNWQSSETSVIEDFIDGEAVRIMLIGNKSWQIKLTGDTWLKSIHNDGSDQMEIDTELLDDSIAIAKHFNSQMIGVDYIVGNDGQKYLLEVNHIPNVTVFPFINEAFIDYAINWVTK